MSRGKGESGGTKRRGGRRVKGKDHCRGGGAANTASGVRETPNRGHYDDDQRALKKKENESKVEHPTCEHPFHS